MIGRIALILPALFVGAACANEGDLPSLPAGRTFHRAVAVDGKILSLGGFGARAHFDVFDIEANRWSQRKLPFQHERILLPAVVDKQIYVLDVIRREFRRYDVATDKWTDLAPMSAARAHSALASCNGKLFAIGGYGKNVTKRNSVEIYDPAANRWTLGPPLPKFTETDHFHLTAAVDGKLHVVGHYFGGKDHWVLDNNRWAQKADAPVVCGWKAASLESVEGKLWLTAPFHSRDEGKDNDIFVYTPSEDRWTPAGRTPKGFPELLSASASVGADIYSFGGHETSTAVFKYNTKDGTWESSPANESPSQ
jgi:N-acetylneuraminic acid mutarotase